MTSPPRPGLPRYGLLAFALLAGCADHPAPPQRNEPQIQKFASKGYLSEEQYSIKTTPLAWIAAGHGLEFMLSAPVRAGRYPLIIYLPGLGEARTAGDAWRNAWAQAGYAVLSIQLLAEDRQLWQLRAARSGDFKPLIRERFATSAMLARQDALRSLLAELARRADDPLLANVDLSRIVLAGYDIGAYTAMVAAGEKIDATVPHAVPVAAIVSLSPYAGFSGPAFEGRYSAIAAPVLSITGEGDTDDYGFVSSAALRTAPYDYMPPGGKYLLMLDDASHALFAGGRPEERTGGAQEYASHANTGREDDTRGGGRRRRGSGGGGFGEMPGGQPRGGREGQSPMAGWDFAQSAIRAVTTAFLDAEVKQDSFAREWLARDARRWLRDTANLTVK